MATVPPESFAIELEAIVQDERIGDPKPCDDVFPDKPLNVHISDVR